MKNTPIFFKIWFGFAVSLAVGALVLLSYTAYIFVTDPNASEKAQNIGRFVGEIQGGYDKGLSNESKAAIQESVDKPLEENPE